MENKEHGEVGRPPIFKTVEEIQEAINSYESLCEEKNKPMTFSGLAYHLGFSRRATLNDYARKDDPISVPVKRAMLRIEQDYEERLYEKNPTGSIFALKNRGWTDRQQVEHSGEIKTKIESLTDDELDERIRKLEQIAET